MRCTVCGVTARADGRGTPIVLKCECASGVTRTANTLVPDGQRCINCKVPARNGVITHLHSCPDYVKNRMKEKK